MISYIHYLMFAIGNGCKRILFLERIPISVLQVFSLMLPPLIKSEGKRLFMVDTTTKMKKKKENCN
ncbi:hypothetical protein DXA61_20195 [Bacteroides intestinalis]|uniref:Uncharacterized protein n=1 Tax=Bacteroides intestinalis TaxID=329854 RepID=A0A412P118_9BACE|nr:hypothetical protein DWX27_19165 [Bacteroides intestinalis]RGX82720.1 hypothetical protein DXA61_20195 [Bacteroides intestinalis]RYT78996.1 hypothetical protein EAJ06_16030 [Bacteroides intestinalis]